MMNGNTHESYENLVTILAVSAIVVIIGITVKMIDQHSVPFVASVKPIKGYVRPDQIGQKGEQKGSHTVPIVRQEIPGITPPAPVIQPRDYAKIKQRFDQAVALMHAKQYEYAITALNEIVGIQPDMPEVYVNLGYAYLGLKNFPSSQNAFAKAIDLKPDQANAYYGLAIAFEGNNDLEPALGAMRSFIHLSDPNGKFVAKARSAIWEWEQRLGRNPEAPPPMEKPQSEINPDTP